MGGVTYQTCRLEEEEREEEEREEEREEEECRPSTSHFGGVTYQTCRQKYDNFRFSARRGRYLRIFRRVWVGLAALEAEAEACRQAWFMTCRLCGTSLVLA
jgi:hypothetical protein